MTAFIVMTGSGVVPAWVTTIIIWRELAVTGLRLLIVEQNGQVLAAKMQGKIKTTTQFIAIIFLILNNVIYDMWGIPFGQIMLYICLFFTVYSGVDYFVKGRGVFADGAVQAALNIAALAPGYNTMPDLLRGKQISE